MTNYQQAVQAQARRELGRAKVPGTDTLAEKNQETGIAVGFLAGAVAFGLLLSQMYKGGR